MEIKAGTPTVSDQAGVGVGPIGTLRNRISTCNHPSDRITASLSRFIKIIFQKKKLLYLDCEHSLIQFYV